MKRTEKKVDVSSQSYVTMADSKLNTPWSPRVLVFQSMTTQMLRDKIAYFVL